MSWKIVPRNNAKHQLIQSDCYHESPLPNLTGIVRKSILYMCAHCTIAMIQIDLIFKRIEAIEASRLRFEDVVICCFNTIRIFLTQRRSAATIVSCEHRCLFANVCLNITPLQKVS